MKRRVVAFFMVLAVLGTMFYGCKRKEPEEKVIRVMSYTDELLTLVQTYLEMHPELGYTVKMAYPNWATANIDYDGFLEDMLTGEYEVMPDIYGLDEYHVGKYIKGSMSSYAATYDELGIPTDQMIRESETAPYAVAVGTRTSDKAVVALPYQSGAGGFIYRRSIAKEVWGTDDPAVIQEKIGGCSGSWDAFWNAAEELKQKGYAIVSGDGDLWYAMRNDMDAGWIVDDELYLSPEREAFMDISKRLTDYGYSNGTVERTDAGFADMSGLGEKEVFGFFGPAWFVSYTLTNSCGDSPLTEEYETGTYGDWAVCNAPVGFYQGGKWVAASENVVNMEKKAVVADIIKWITLEYDENSLQYQFANGTFAPYLGAKQAAVSGKVMEIADGCADVVSGQNMFEYYKIANNQEMEVHITEYDSVIDLLWRDAVREYAQGKKSREEAIAGFKAAVKEKVDIRGAGESSGAGS
jgi:hypothetical protein